jgi:cyclophilin family peptidyl-prolyl cis-trans isomerase
MRILFSLVLFVAAAGLVACGGGSDGTSDDQAAGGTTSEPATETQAEQPMAGTPDAGEEEVNAILERSLKKDPGPADELVNMKTNMGLIVLRFYPKQAPLAVANFKGLAAKGYYDGIIFHRVIDGFMIQGGDPTGTGFSGESLWGGKFKDEPHPDLRFEREGLLAMANSGPNTNGSQFFITLAPTPHLNDKHTIFGEVVEGMDVVRAIGKVRKNKDKPAEDVVMESVTVVPAGS